MQKHGCGAAILSHNCLNPQQWGWTRELISRPRISVLLMQRGADAPTFPNCWGMPGGLLEEGEEPFQTAAREALEEVGVRFSPLLPAFYEGEWENRKLSYFTGWWEAPQNIVVQASEVADWRWFTFEEALNLPLSFRYPEAIKELSKRFPR